MTDLINLLRQLNELNRRLATLETNEYFEDWQTPSLENGWTDYGLGFNPAGYYIDEVGVVHLRGVVKNGSIGSAIFTLPSGYRPAYQFVFATSTYDSVFARCDVTAAGLTTPVAGSNIWFSLDGLSFRAG